MEEILREALEPVLRDVASSGLLVPRFEDKDWNEQPEHPCAMLWNPDGTGRGVSVSREETVEDRIAQAADQVQEAVIEAQLWGRAPTNWPRCPYHPVSHPMLATAEGGLAVWVCPVDRRTVEEVGRLGAGAAPAEH